MKVRFVELEGASQEMRETLGALIGQPLPAPGTEDGERLDPAARKELEGTLLEAAGVDVVDVTPDLGAGEVLDGGPFESPHDVPVQWRWFNAAGMTCHLREQPGLAIAMCGTSPRAIGSRRLHDTDVPFKNTEVCGGCNAALVRSRRND